MSSQINPLHVSKNRELSIFNCSRSRGLACLFYQPFNLQTVSEMHKAR